MDKPHWKELFREVVTTGLCTGCAACVVACPHDVLAYDDPPGTFLPWHVDAEGGREDCTHGERGCTMCTRACARFRTWEREIDVQRAGRERHDDEVFGVGDVILARALDAEEAQRGQDGGFVTAALCYALETGIVDAALVSGLADGEVLRAEPTVVRTRAEVLASAGSRYTYSANLLAYPEAAEGGAERIALVGMGCMASAPGAMQARKAGKIARRLSLTIGLLCSKTFDERLYRELVEGRYGIPRAEIAKVNIKGVLQIWTRDGALHEIPLKEAHAYTREGCLQCPDFAAEHADLSAGGIGADNDWTLVVVRTELGRSLVAGLVGAGRIEVRPGDEDPGALALLRRLATVSRRRWPETAEPGPRRLPVRPG